MEQRTITLTWPSIRSGSFLLCFFFLLLIPSAGATEYTVRPSQSDQFGASVAGEDVQEIEVIPIPYWLFLFWLGFTQITSTPEVLSPAIRLFLVLSLTNQVIFFSTSSSQNNATHSRLAPPAPPSSAPHTPACNSSHPCTASAPAVSSSPYPLPHALPP